MKGNNNDKIKIHERLARLETKVETILTNHLPHIQKSIDRLSNRFWAAILLLIANLIALVFIFLK